ncbi:MAG: hypothetical protein HRT42_13990 [Campylobacteraceae bacterium]|nr:hypothetical protein [Campylobacteraceae bacterium]
MAKVVNKNIKITQAEIEEDKVFKDETIKVLSEFEQGDLSKRIKTTVNNPALKELKKVLDSIANTLEENIGNILLVLGEYSNYKYVNKVNNKSVKNQLLQLANGVNSLEDSITLMLVDNKHIALNLSKSSTKFLDNVNAVNISSHKASSPLEKTSAALEEVTSTIVNNTQRISEMSQYANEVVNSIKEGNTLANETSKSMDVINEQVSSINAEIGVIDQIEF